MDSVPNKKYELGPVNPLTGLRRIKALAAIPALGVMAGDEGGWIASEKNLQVSGDAWVSGNARVSGDAQVYGDAWVSGNAQVSGDARVEKPIHTYGISGPITPNADHATLVRLKDDKHVVTIGCWSGTIKELRALAASDAWPSEQGPEYRDQWRQSLLDVADLFNARRKMWKSA